jgi:hypothetical protein
MRPTDLRWAIVSNDYRSRLNLFRDSSSVDSRRGLAGRRSARLLRLNYCSNLQGLCRVFRAAHPILVSDVLRFGPIFPLVQSKWHPEMVFATTSSMYRRSLNG